MKSNVLMYMCGNVPKRGDLITLGKVISTNTEIGAMARVKRIYTIDEVSYIDIIWLDEKAGSQSDGGYYSDSFKLVSRWVDELAEKHKEDILDKWGGKGLALFKKFYKIVEVSGKISLRNLAEELDLGVSECKERVWDWAYILGYIMRDDHVFSTNS